jgi:hypothetical protein
MAAGIARGPSWSVPRSFDDGAEREAAYRFIENDDFSYGDIAASMRAATARRAAEHPFAYVAIDESSMTLTDRCGKGFGTVGGHGKGARGMHAVTALAISPRGVPLGVAGLSLWTRTNKGKPPHYNDDVRPPEQRETQHWLQVLDDVAKTFSLEAPDTVPWVQMDRGADRAWILATATRLGVKFTLRSSYDRKILGGKKLWPVLARAPLLGTYDVQVPRGHDRSSRRARLEIRAKHVEMRVALGARHRKPYVTVGAWAVEARERNPPRGQSRILWRLLSSHRAAKLASAVEVIDGYVHRWRVEQLHYAWKTGLCDIERSQLRTPERFAKWATILVAVAARAERLKMLSREEPDLPAATEFTRDEIDAVILLRKPKGVEAGADPTLGQVVRWIADLGGYTGKSSGGPPGVAIITRALPKVEAAAIAVAAMRPRQRRKK